MGRSDMGTTCFNCVLSRGVLTIAQYAPILASPQESHKHILLNFYSPTVSCLSVAVYFNVITVRLAYTEIFLCDFLCRIHACNLFSTGLFLLLFNSCNLCISSVTSAKYKNKHNGISKYVQHTLVHIIYKIQNCYFGPHGSSLKILILHPWASKEK